MEPGLTIGDILRVKGGAIVSIRPDKTVAEAAQLLKSKRIGVLLVAEPGGRVTGLLSERDIVGAIAQHGAEGAYRQVQEIMTKRMVVCQPFDDAKQVMTTMKNGKFRHMPVMEEGLFKGMISIGDILHHLLEYDQMVEERNIFQNL